MTSLPIRATLWAMLAGCATTAAPPPSDGWSFVVLPDTQIYSRMYPEIYEAQTEWIAAQRDTRHIAFVLHVGDIVDTNTTEEWMNARRAMEHLQGVVPYALVPGNHDYGTGGSADVRTTPLLDFFPYEEQAAQPHFGGSYEQGKLDDTYHVFETPEGPWLVLALEFGPRPDALRWAREIGDAHRGMPAVLLTHAYLYFDDTRYDHVTRTDQYWTPYSYGLASGGVTDGQEMFDALVEPLSDLEIVVCGHVLADGVARLTSTRPDGTVAHQLLANFQEDDLGGGGFLRIVDVHPDRFDVHTYSPYLDRSRTEPDHEFTLVR